ncbi:MAG: hypothetical protein ACYC4U_04670 [Pirellulaceae bacterium]
MNAASSSSLRRVGILLCVLGMGKAGAGYADPPSPFIRPGIRHSDVVFMYDDPTMYEAYGCTVMGWAGKAEQAHIRNAHAKGVRLFSVSVGFLTEFQGMIDFSGDYLDAAARNYAGEPFVVPWLWDHKHKGQPAWWWCTNSPLYRQYLESRLRERMPAGPDGLHIDDYRGSSGSVGWLSGCFCRHCLAGFRAYLADKGDPDELQRLGISDLETFDYRQFLIDRGVTAEKYKQESWAVPLADAFHDFQVTANTKYVGEYRQLAEEIRGAALTLSVNSGLEGAQALAIAPQLTYFCCEVPHNAASLAAATEPIYIYKLGEGLQRPIASTASGQDWAYVAEHSKPCLVRTWIALSYALGNNLMAPHRQWCYTEEKGTHWYSGPVDQYAFMYQFVREQAPLLDNYETLAPVAVVYDNAANRRYRGRVDSICVELARRNIPYRIVVAGDTWLDHPLTAEQLADYRAVITTQDQQWLDASQRALLEEVKSSGRLITWPDDEALARLVPSPVTLLGSDNVLVFPRTTPADPTAPLVLHLLNQDYDGQNDVMRPQSKFTVRMRRDLLPERSFTTATLHAPQQESVPLIVRTDSTQIEIELPGLTLWGIVKLE